MKITDVAKTNFSDILSSKGLIKVSLPSYHDAKHIKRFDLRTASGMTVLNLDVSPRDKFAEDDTPYELQAMKPLTFFGGTWPKKNPYLKFKTEREMIQFISGLKFVTQANHPSDVQILKFLNDHLQSSLKLSEIKGMKFNCYGTSTILKEPNDGHYFLYTVFVEGDRLEDENVGLGKIGLNTKLFREWLVKHGAKKVANIKHTPSVPYYD